MLERSTEPARRLVHAALLMILAGCHDDLSSAADEPELHGNAPAAQVAAPAGPLPPPPVDHPEWPRSAVTVAGQGCRPGVATLSAYRGGFDLAFPDFTLENKGRASQRKNCIVLAQLPGTPGWEYAIRRTRILGRDSLSPGAKRYYQVGVGSTYKTNTTTGSAASEPNSRFGQTVEAAPNWSGCGATVPRSVTLLLMLDSLQDAGTQIDRLMVDFTWRRCSQ